MDSLSQLETTVRELLDRYQQLKAENEDLRLRLTDREEDLIQAHAELKTLRERNRTLTIARSLSETDESREAARQQLTAIISQVDKALAVLKQ